MNISFTRITQLTDPLFQKANKLLQDSFVAEEYREYTQELLQNPVFTMRAVFAEQSFVGVITCWEFEEFVFLEHIATDPKVRGQSIGALVIQATIDLHRGMIHIGEIERPETEIAVRRMGFFKRLGFQINPYDYIQPPYGEGKAPVPMLMISLPEILSQEVFERIKERLYSYVYHVKTKDFSESHTSKKDY
jgi:GNAT superfamily N-acetyltransferase